MRICSVCGREMPDSARFCSECGGATVAMEPEASVYAPVAVATRPHPQKRVKAGVVIAAVVALLVVAVVVGLLTDWLGLVSPVHGLENALKRTVRADSLTITIEGKTDDGDDVERIQQTYRFDLDKKKENVTYIVQTDEDTSMYDNGDYYYLREPDEDYHYPNGQAYVDESEEEKPNKQFFKTYNKVFAKNDIRWDEVVKLASLEGGIDKKEIDDFMAELSKKYLGDRDWLESNLGFERKGNVYTFAPDMENLGEALLGILEETDAVKEGAKEDIEDAIDDMMDYAEDEDVSLMVSVTVKNGVVSLIRVEYSADDGVELEVDITITGYNKTAIDSKEIMDLRDTIDQRIEENTCEECGFNLLELWYGEYHGDCYYCGEHSDGECYYDTYDDEPCCERCYYHYEYGWDECSECGDFADLYEVGDNELCYECYYTCCDCGTEAGYTKGNYRYCYDCYYVCDTCGEESSYTYGSAFYCYDCYFREVKGYVDCDDCGTLCDPYEYDGKELCSDCYLTAKYVCSRCGSSGTYAQGSKYYCYDCYYTCYYCGDTAYYSSGNYRYCYDCYCGVAYGYEYCDECGEMSDPYYYDGQTLCYNCYDDALHTCEICGGGGAYYTYDGYDMCWDCYWEY